MIPRVICASKWLTIGKKKLGNLTFMKNYSYQVVAWSEYRPFQFLQLSAYLSRYSLVVVGREGRGSVIYSYLSVLGLYYQDLPIVS